MFQRISTLCLACLMFIAFGGIQQAIAATDANKAIVRRLHEEVWNQRKLSVIDEIISPTFVRHIPPNPDIRGPEGLKQYAIALLPGFPDFHLTTEDMIAEGDRVVNRFTARGTHKGEFLGIPPTGKPVIATGIGIFHIVGGMIKEDWLLLDNVGLLQQLGVIPPAGGEDYTWGKSLEVTGNPGDPEANKALDRRFIEEAFNKGNLAVIDEIFSPTYLRHEPPNPDQVLGIEGFKQFVTVFRTAFPDLQITLEEQIAEGGNVVPRFTIRGTHTGEFLGIPPTGKKVMITGISIHRFADGKLVESWTKLDQLGLLQQLGVIPTPEAPTAETVVKEYIMVDQSGSPTDWKAALSHPQEIEVITLETGEIEVPRGLVLNLEAPAASGLPADNVWVKVYAHLIRHKVKGDFLIDTGYDKSFSETPHGNLACWNQLFGISFKQKPGQDIKAQLEKHDAKLRGVFFTHLHGDHTSGVLDLPKDIQYIAGKGDMQAYMAVHVGDWGCDNQLEGVKVLKEIDFSKARDMPPMGKAIDVLGDGSLWALWTPGHTEGHISYLVNRTDGPVLLTGDASHTRWGFENNVEPGLVVDRTVAQRSLAQLRELVQQFPSIEVRYGHELAAEDFSHVFFMSLSEGLNLISLPLKPRVPFTARSFAEMLSATVVIKLDEVRQRFVGFTLDAPDDGFPIEGGAGYIVNVPQGKVVTFVGAAWANQPPVTAAPPLAYSDGAWAFVVSGRLVDNRVDAQNQEGYWVTLRNTRTNAVATDVVREGYFAAAFADVSRQSVVEVGDWLEVTVMDRTGEIASDAIRITVTPETLRQAFVQLPLTNVGKPRESLLLQNYPNPFNPDTWIPYQLQKSVEVAIHIYDAKGGLVRTLDLGQRESGFYRSRTRAAYWDGRNDAGEPVASGVYFYQLRAGDFSETRRMVIVK